MPSITASDRHPLRAARRGTGSTRPRPRWPFDGPDKYQGTLLDFCANQPVLDLLDGQPGPKDLGGVYHSVTAGETWSHPSGKRRRFTVGVLVGAGHSRPVQWVARFEEYRDGRDPHVREWVRARNPRLLGLLLGAVRDRMRSGGKHRDGNWQADGAWLTFSDVREAVRRHVQGT